MIRSHVGVLQGTACTVACGLIVGPCAKFLNARIVLESTFYFYNVNRLHVVVSGGVSIKLKLSARASSLCYNYVGPRVLNLSTRWT